MEKKFYLNQDHQKVSIIIPIILIVLIIIMYRILFRTALPLIFGGQSGDYILIAGVLSLFISAFIMWLVDPFVKGFFPSGHVLTIDTQYHAFVYSVDEEAQVELSDRQSWQMIHWDFLMGRFIKSGRERQVPRGWSCMAILIQATGKELVLFSYVPPRTKKKFSQLATWETISMYDTFDDDSKSRNLPRMRPPTLADVIPGRLLVGEKGQVWLAERKRRENGVEMSAKDFEQLLTYLSTGSFVSS